MSFINPIARAKGMGSAKEGVTHWWRQRLTALLLIPLIIWTLIAVSQLAGAGFAEARAFVGAPLNAGLLLILLWATAYHGQLGVQVVIEDYIHTRWLELTLLLLVKLAALIVVVMGTLAVLRIALGA